MDHGVLVYKGRQSCTEFSIEFSYVNPIQGSIYWSTLRSLSCNTTILSFWLLHVFFWLPLLEKALLMPTIIFVSLAKPGIGLGIS